jgi:hypothetical protein
MKQTISVSYNLQEIKKTAKEYKKIIRSNLYIVQQLDKKHDYLQKNDNRKDSNLAAGN